MPALEKDGLKKGVHRLSERRRNWLFVFSAFFQMGREKVCAVLPYCGQVTMTSVLWAQLGIILENRSETAFYLRPGKSSHQPVDQSTILKKQKGRDALNGVLRSGQRVFIHV
jgi:hypothetical protein